ncbi:MAG TPA: oligosaccharide flippase family protein [Vicinamibacterales bacterium]|nr:oligosaccharide flippase family protein [Vicinamibacterales bacterium]
MTDGRPHRWRAGGAWALTAAVVTLGSGLLRTVAVARFLDPADVGVMAVALLALGATEALATTGVDTALIAQRKQIDPYLDPAFTVQAVRGVIVTAVLWMLAPWVGWVFGSDRAVDVIRAVGIVPAIRGLANPALAVAVRRLDFRRVFWWSLPETVSSLGLAVGLAYLWRDVWALVVATLAGQIVGTVASYGVVRRAPRLVLARARIAELLRTGRFVSGSRALMYFSANLDGAAVGVLLGTPALGLYQFATRIAELPVVTFARAAGQVALPALSAASISEAERSATWRTLLRAVITVHAIAAALFLTLGEFGVRTVAGERWMGAVPLLRVLALAMLFRGVIVLTGQFLDAVGRPDRTLLLNAARLGLLIVLLPAGHSRAGAQGIAVAVLVASAAASLIGLRFAAWSLRDHRPTSTFGAG